MAIDNVKVQTFLGEDINAMDRDEGLTEIKEK